MSELAKILGAIAWVAGIPTLFAAPAAALLILLITVVLIVYTTTKTREVRHRELLGAQQQATVVSRERHTVRSSPTAERLKELAELRNQGAITEDEYQAKRQGILDSI